MPSVCLNYIIRIWNIKHGVKFYRPELLTDLSGTSSMTNSLAALMEHV